MGVPIMIMISDMTLNNYTVQATPNWMAADNFSALLSQKHQSKSILDRVAALLMMDTSKAKR